MNRIAFVAALFIWAMPANAAQTIVGKWAINKADCADPEQHLAIRPMSISGGFSCVFNKVKRKGDIVTWAGHCFSPDGSRRPETGDEDRAMVATLKNGKLSLYGLGLSAGPLLRCK